MCTPRHATPSLDLGGGRGAASSVYTRGSFGTTTGPGVSSVQTAVTVSAVGAVCLARGYAVPHNRKPHSVAASCLSVSRLPSVHCWRYTYRVLLVLPSAPAGATYTGGGGPARPARVVLAVRRVVSGPPGLPNNILYSHTDLYYTLTPLTARLGRGVVRAGAAAKSLYLATFQRAPATTY